MEWPGASQLPSSHSEAPGALHCETRVGASVSWARGGGGASSWKPRQLQAAGKQQPETGNG
jgi:hypothetical protein